MNGRTETPQTLVEWAEETFGAATTIARVAARANEEMSELLKHATIEPLDYDQIAIEAADVTIVLARVAHLCGHDLWDAVEHKMAINRQREWRRDGTGHGYHVRTKEASQ